MAEPAPPSQPPTLEALWLTLFTSSVVFGMVLVGVALMLDRAPFAPAWRDAMLLVTGLSVLPSILLLRRWRDQLAVRHDRSDVERFRQLQTSLTLGLAAADLPALAGFLHHLATGELLVLVGGCIATIVIMYLYRPVTGLRA